MTALDLFNKALAAIGYTRFLASQESKFLEGVTCRREWDGARHAILTAHEWGWLALEIPVCDANPDTCTVNGTESYLYPRPPGAIRITGALNAEGRTVKCTAVNNGIRTAEIVASMRYIPDSTAPDEWPTAVQDAIAYELAARIAPALKPDANLIRSMKQLSANALQSATAKDSAEVRYGGTSANRYAESRR